MPPSVYAPRNDAHILRISAHGVNEVVCVGVRVYVCMWPRDGLLTETVTHMHFAGSIHIVPENFERFIRRSCGRLTFKKSTCRSRTGITTTVSNC
jgi:hypothetical protein